jgi:hypothetical protein
VDLTMNQVTMNGQYSPLTKSIDIDEMLMLIDLAHQHNSVDTWQQEAMLQLPQASRQRRQEIVRAVKQKFLETEDDAFVVTPLYTLLTQPTLDGRLKRDLLFAQYLRATPLIWQAVQQVVLPHAEAASQPLAQAEDAEVAIEDWMHFLESRLNTRTESTVVKTRQHITGHLVKFGLLEARPVPGDRIAKRFFAHFHEPDPRAFWFSLALEFSEMGWASRSLGFIANSSWTRTAYCARPTYVRFVMEEAERAALVNVSYFGSEKQVSFRGPDPVASVVKVIRYG